MPIRYTGHDGWPLTAFVPEDASPDAPVLVLMHGGGPDHRSLVPLARRLAGSAHVILPDIRGYGRSVCADPARHTWAQYAQDVIALLDHLGVDRALVGGAGLGTTISLRTALANPERVAGLVLISLEDIEDAAAKQDEIAFMEAFAARVREGGLDAAWDPILPHLSPVIGAMVREALPHADPASAAAAAAIGYDRAFCSVDELVAIDVPTLIIPGADWRHPAGLARQLAEALPYGRLAAVAMSTDLQSSGDFGRSFAPVIQKFLIEFSDIFSNIKS
ncbi:alpha/beta fold hydrolase [Novilysobacter arseniciresistens]|uniref:alpha/beta fold hydrolase n=1 Tax=Novilysobacter arseniciresistens TaxID=1385522 RepID=UPI0023A925F4|nr:alpha/beta hydrolase [Lysobacter arseniciresistens]